MGNRTEFSKFLEEFNKNEYERSKQNNSRWGTPEYYNFCDAGKTLYDGEYDLGDLAYLIVDLDPYKDGKNHEEAMEFIKANPNYCIGQGYQSPNIVIVADRPKRYDGSVKGHYARGATCVFEKPCRLLLIAEDD